MTTARQFAFVARPEKALLDLVHLTAGNDLSRGQLAREYLQARIGKLHAILTRPWPKGRDLFDLAWYLTDRTWPAPNLVLLNAALAQTQTQTRWAGQALTDSNWRPEVRRHLATHGAAPVAHHDAPMA